MAKVLTQCPRVTSPCPRPPEFARGEKSVFCGLCQTRVHNLSAMSASERAALLSRGGPLCVRYSHFLPAAALLVASGAALAQDSVDQAPQMEMETVEVGGATLAVSDLVFLESEEGDDAWMDESQGTDSE